MATSVDDGFVDSPVKRGGVSPAPDDELGVGGVSDLFRGIGGIGRDGIEDSVIGGRDGMLAIQLVLFATLGFLSSQVLSAALWI